MSQEIDIRYITRMRRKFGQFDHRMYASNEIKAWFAKNILEELDKKLVLMQLPKKDELNHR